MNRSAVDTHPAAEGVQVALLRGATVARRVGLARSLSATAMDLAWRAIQRAHPHAGEGEVALTFLQVHYGQLVADGLRAAVHRRTVWLARGGGEPPGSRDGARAPARRRTRGAPARRSEQAAPISRDVLAAVTPVVDALEGLGVAYHIGGSLASSAYGVARTTLDVDLVAELLPQHVQPLVDRLAAAYYVDEAAVREAVRQHRSANVIHLETMIKVDVFVPEGQPFDRSEARRARPSTLEGAAGARTFFIKSPEDVVLRKLEWYRAGGEVSERQWGDVLGVLKVQAAALERGYLQRWAASLGVTDLLERALREAGL